MYHRYIHKRSKKNSPGNLASIEFIAFDFVMIFGARAQPSIINEVDFGDVTLNVYRMCNYD